MRKELSNILICGLVSTGSSALVDLLREYNNMNHIPGEFDDFRAPGLVADQLSHPQSVEFINEIEKLTNLDLRSRIKWIYNVLPIFTIFKWEIKKIRGIRGRFRLLLTRNRQLNLLKKLNIKLYSDISFKDKIRYANQWIADVGGINLNNNEFVVYNQPIHLVIDTCIWKEVFHPWKLICVYRDPKDQLAEIIKNGYFYAPYGAPYVNHGGAVLETIYGRSRKGAMNFHIDALRKRFEWIDFMKKEFDSDQFLLIDFEGLVNNYDEYKSIIENFIGGIKPHHKNVKSYFDPINAKKSIGIYKEYLNGNEIESLKELENWYKNMIKSNLIIQKTKACDIKRMIQTKY